MGLLSYDAKEIVLDKIKDFNIPKEDISKLSKMREDFVSFFTPEKIKSLSPEDYFPGLGKKDDCLGYQLEWGTIDLGSIKGGSIVKYGTREQFSEIKNLLIDLTGLTDEMAQFYEADGNLTQKSKSLISNSLKIRGMKSGRTVLGKILSIYYPATFIALFNDQDYFLGKMVKDYSNDYVGLESYIRNNYLLLKIKEELLSEPVFIKALSTNEFNNDVFCRFLYFCFDKTRETEEIETEQEIRMEALETEHYQKLIHRNFSKLFKNYRYYDEETQNSHEGHYSTEDAGTMDFLCVDESDNLIVIELKRKGTDETLAQLCRYMGWVKENLAKENQKVLGIIISESKDIKLEYAIKVVPNVTLKQMTLDVIIKDFEYTSKIQGVDKKHKK